MGQGLNGKAAIVTGASTLIGAKVAAAFAAAGTRVILADINAETGKAIAAEIGDNARFLETDVTRDADIDRCLAQCEKDFGRVDFLVNLASTYLDHGLGSSREDWLAALNVNLVSMAIFTEKARPFMRRQGGGAIVNFASISGKRAQPARMLYPTSKAGILQLTRSSALELAADHIRINSVSPGWIWSNIMVQLTGDKRAKADAVGGPFHMLGRIGDPEEVARAVLFLCSDDASFITGTDLAVDGGYTALGPEQMQDAVSKLAD